MLQIADYFTQNELKLTYRSKKFFRLAHARHEGMGEEGPRHKILPQGPAIEVTPLHCSDDVVQTFEMCPVMSQNKLNMSNVGI
jgi:hypothetical protein